MRIFAILLGAGASEPFEIPPMTRMVNEFEKKLRGEERSKWKEVKEILTKSGIKPDLEAMLTIFSKPILIPHNLDPQVAYYLKLPDEKIEIINSSFARSLEKKVRKYIWDVCNLKEESWERKKQLNSIYDTYDEFFRILTMKIHGSEAENSLITLLTQGMLDIYTTNYDRCLEIYFQSARFQKANDKILLDEGLRGRYWSTLYYEEDNTPRNRIYKLHGSIQRYWTNKGIRDSESYLEEGKLINGDEVVKQMLIWPLRAKPIYEYPFSNMFDKFREQLRLEVPLIVIGHSLRDKAILDILLSVVDEVSEKKKKGIKGKFKMLLMDPNAEDIKNERLKPIENFLTIVPHKFGTEIGFQQLSEALKRF